MYFVYYYTEEIIINQKQISHFCKRKAVDSVIEKPSKII